jgi:hypothetical protein
MMRTRGRLQQISCCSLLGVLTCASAAAAAVHPPARQAARVPDRIVIVIEATAVRDHGEYTFAGGAVLAHGIMAHRLTLDVLDSEGARIEAKVEAAIRATAPAAGSRLLGHVTTARPVFDLPRPLGLRLEAGDSVQLHGRVSAAGTEPVYVVIMMEYEPLDAPSSRLPVHAVQIQLNDAMMIEWRSPVDGRVMALAGLGADLAGELMLEDAETGAVLWRDMLRPASGEAFGGGASVVRIGTQVSAGRLYRLTLRTGAGEPPAAAELLLHVLLVPLRTVQCAEACE